MAQPVEHPQSARAAQAAQPTSTQDRLAQFTDEQLAYHEAGHAVVHHLQGGIVTRLSIERTDPQPGTHIAPRPSLAQAADPQRALRDVISVQVAGEVAATLSGAPAGIVAAGGKVDRERAVQAAASVGVDEAAAQVMIEEAWSHVRAMLEDPAAWKLVQTTAEQLLHQKVLVADLFRATITP